MGLQRFAAYTELPDPAERWVAAGLGRGNLDVTSLLEVHHTDEGLPLQCLLKFTQQST